MYLNRNNVLSYNTSINFIVLKRGYGKSWTLGAKDRCITCVPSTFPTTPGFKIEVSRVNSTNTAETGTYFAYYATGYLSE